MQYILKEPKSELLRRWVKSFWMVESKPGTEIKREKIVPDGYPEVIFHYGAPYRAQINGSWHLQSKWLIAGQIRNYFYLENTGDIGMFAIKFQPWALHHLLDLQMADLTDRVIPVEGIIQEELLAIGQIATVSCDFESKMDRCENQLIQMIGDKDNNFPTAVSAIEMIIQTNASLSLSEIRRKTGVGERSLERYFQRAIGVSPKFYSRIIRFSHIFELVQKNEKDWSGITYQAGFYDQSHFIKNFKEFTGDDPSAYPFFEKNIANFFFHK